jgi:ABC-type spermidine/putrescine transport system permease subunit II
MDNIYSTNNISIILLIGLISTFISLLIIYIPHFLTYRKYKKISNEKVHGAYITPFLTPSWIITSIWIGITAFVLLADGKFLESGLANHIIWASIILSVVTVVGSKLSHYNDIKLTRGNISLMASKNNIQRTWGDGSINNNI